MANYQLRHAGAVIDEAIDKALTALQEMPEHTHSVEEIDGLVSGGTVALNLLDNSNWERRVEIVNQRGQSSYTGAVYGIDRWRSLVETNVVTINDDCMSLSGEAHFAQYIDSARFKSGVAYTFAVKKKNGAVLIVSGTCPMTAAVEGDGIRFKVSDSDESYVTISAAGEYVWAALYEGEYTAETLPEYIPKGYAAELMECQRYYQQYSVVGLTCRNNGYATTLLPVTMRVAPTISVGARRLYTTSYEDVSGAYPNTLGANTTSIFFNNSFYEGFVTITCNDVSLSADL